MQAAAFRTGQIQLLHGAGDADIGQPAFLFQTVGTVHAHLVREQAFFHAGHEHQRELQPLGAVQGHQLYAVFVLFGLGFAGFQHCMVKKGHQRRQLLFIFFLLVGERLGSGDQFFQVLHP